MKSEIIYDIAYNKLHSNLLNVHLYHKTKSLCTLFGKETPVGIITRIYFPCNSIVYVGHPRTFEFLCPKCYFFLFLLSATIGVLLNVINI